MKAAEDSYMCIQNDTCSSGKENHNVECNPVWLTVKKNSDKFVYLWYNCFFQNVNICEFELKRLCVCFIFLIASMV